MPRMNSPSPEALDDGSETPDPGLLKPSQAKRRQRIIDCAHEMIVERGHANVHMRDIAERADVALGTAYRYFGSKERLLAEVYAEWGKRNNEAIGADLRRARSNRKRIELFAFRVLESFAMEPSMGSVWQELRIAGDPAIIRIIELAHADTRELCRRALRGIDDRDTDAIAVLVTSVGGNLIDRMGANLISLAEAKREIAEVIRIVFDFSDPQLGGTAPAHGSLAR